MGQIKHQKGKVFFELYWPVAHLMFGYVAIKKIAIFENTQPLDLFLSGLHCMRAVHLRGVKVTQTRGMKIACFKA